MQHYVGLFGGVIPEDPPTLECRYFLKPPHHNKQWKNKHWTGVKTSCLAVCNSKFPGAETYACQGRQHEFGSQEAQVLALPACLQAPSWTLPGQFKAFPKLLWDTLINSTTWIEGFQIHPPEEAQTHSGLSHFNPAQCLQLQKEGWDSEGCFLYLMCHAE